ncbi:MAG: hypothetical protein AAFP07_04795 [Cyanobacteria bacterium J06606_4]
MVSPLQTWAHREPKGLWPALGGLAVVAHVGVLGLSLPYVLTLMQPSDAQSAAVVPIELIEAEADVATPTEPSVEPDPNPSAEPRTAPSPARESASGPPSAQPPSSTSAEPPTPTNPAATEDILTADDPPVVAQDEPPSDTTGTETPVEPDEPPAEPETVPPDEEADESPDSDTAEEEPDLPSEPAEPDDLELPDADLPEEEPQEPAPITEEEDTPPVVPGEDLLPTPEENNQGDDAAQQAYLNIVGHEYVPEDLLRDVTDTPPAPLYEAVTSVTLQPRDVGCGQVDFAERQVTYRVVVRPDGSLQSAVPWTGSIEGRSLSEGERAIACLLVSAGFSFTPATTDGQPVLNDNLLLTIDIIESGLD